MLSGATSLAQDASTNSPPVSQLDPITVTGQSFSSPASEGSAGIITAEQIQNQTYANPYRVLQQVPGVYVRDEDGYGHFPNISLRGTDSVRGAKITTMEDGILMSPAPYTFPADYHVPRIARMSGVEVFKGSTQLRYGPHTTGGALNYLTTPFVALPETEGGKLSASHGYLKSTYGSDNTFFNHGWWGHTEQSGGQTFGAIVELLQNQSDGFRHIDKANDNTGFQLIEPMVRLYWEPDTALKQRIEMRFGYSKFDADETHLGLTDADLRADPTRRYAATQFDTYTSDQYRTSVRHIAEPSQASRIETTAYYSYYSRDWYKLTDIRTPDGRNIPIATALATPGESLDILKGDAPGSWRIRANDRWYHMAGVQSQGDWSFDTGSLEHELTVGARLHYDDGARFERDDRATINGAGDVINFETGRQGAGPAANRQEKVFAFSVFAEDKITVGDLSIKPGLRWEHMKMEYTDLATSGPDLDLVVASENGSEDAFAPGVTLGYDVTETVNVFASYYHGISNPAPRELLRGDAQMETTDGFQLGARYDGLPVQAEVTGFYTEFDNMIANEGLGGSGAIEDSNAGDARLYGVEGAVRWDPMQRRGHDLRLPLRASATYTKSEFIEGNPRATAGSIYSGAQPGNELPYVPELAASFGVGLEYLKFGIYLDATYLGEMHGSASNATDLRDINGNPDARYGKTDEAFIVDLSARYQVTKFFRVLAGIGNLADKEYITGRLPAGARANQPRTYYGGVEFRF